MNLLPTATKYHRDLAYQQKKIRAEIWAKSKLNKWKYDNMAKHRTWLRKYKYKPIKIYTMDKLQDTIITKYNELDGNDQVKYLKESIEWHRQVAHYHMYMERNFATQLQEHPGEKPEENTADSAMSPAKQTAAETQTKRQRKAK